MTTTWERFATDEAEFAGRVAQRFAANLHHVLGTIAADGSPRLSGLEVPIRDGHLWLGMMPKSAKRKDLDRDNRFALHSAPLEEDLAAGDAKVSGRAVPADDDEVALFLSGTEFDPEAGGGMGLFWGDLTRVTLTWVADDALHVQTWTPDGGLISHQVD